MTTKQDALAAAARAIDATYDVDHGGDMHNLPEVARACVTAYLAAREVEGFVMVPVEPTEAMMEAGRRNLGLVQDIYRPMLAARPTDGDS